MPHVLIPLDGSPLAEAVVPLALDLAPSRVTFLHVVEGDEPPAAAEAMFLSAQRRGALPTERQALLRSGRAADVILAVATEVGATLIALSTHGRTGLDRLVLGSVAERVVRAATTPVLLLRAGAPAPSRSLLERPLVGYDGSERAWRGVEALALLGRERLGPVDLVMAHDVAPVQPAAADALMERIIARQRDALLQQTLRATERARHLGVTLLPTVREGRPASVLLEAAEQGQNTLIAVTTHGRTVLTRWIFGSVTEELLHTSPLPLLVVR